MTLKDKKKWITIGGFAALITILVGIKDLWFSYKEHAGNIRMMLRDQQISNNDERTFFICVSDDSQPLDGISVTPVYDNSSDYPIEGFDLRYSMEIADGESPNANSLFERVEINRNTYQYKYKENILPQYSQTYEPFLLKDFSIKNSRYIIRSKASYKGCPSPFIYTVKVWLRVVPKMPSQTIEDWKLSCKDVIYSLQAKPDTYDVYYCCDGQVYNEFGKDFGSITSTKIPKDNNTKKNTSPKREKQNIEKKVKEEKKYIAPVTSTSSRKEVESTNYASETNVSTNDGEINDTLSDYHFVNFSQFIKDSVAYLQLKCDRILRSDVEYYVVTHCEKNSYEAHSFKGNDTDEACVKLYDNEIVDYVNTIKEDLSLTNDVVIEKKDGKIFISNKGDKPIVLEYSFGSSQSILSVLWHSSISYTSDADVSKVQILKTYTFEEKPKEKSSWWEYVAMAFSILIFVGNAVMGGMELFGFVESDNSKWENAAWFFGSIAILIFLIIIFLPLI